MQLNRHRAPISPPMNLNIPLKKRKVRHSTSLSSKA